MSPSLPELHDKRLLVVEDEYLVADDMRRELEALGAHVLGPVPSVAAGLAMLEDDEAIEGAILDVNLCGEMVYPLAGALHAREVPFVFWTGYSSPQMPTEFRAVPRVQKPATATEVVRALLRDIVQLAAAAAPPVALADLYVAPDGDHFLAVRAGPGPIDNAGLVWVGASFIDTGEWSRRLRVPLAPGVPARVPWRHLAGLRHSLAIMG